MMGLNMKEMETMTGAMTREEREEAVKADPNDNIAAALGKDIMRPVVNGLDAVGDALEPLNKKLENFQTKTNLVLETAWQKFKDLF